MQTISPEITLTGKAHYGDALLFDTIDVTVKAGQWTCLLGPSGVGKSTLLRLLAGLDAHVNFDGSITASDNLPLPQRVSYMAQSDLLLPWASVADNVSLGATLRGQKIDKDKRAEIINHVGLSDHANKRPSALSGGQRQRAALARTLMEDRPVVLLDEPFSALDAKTKFQMQELVAKSFEGKTILLVTHDPSEAVRLCAQIYILDDQKVRLTESLQPPFPKDHADPAVFALQNNLLNEIRGN